MQQLKEELYQSLVEHSIAAAAHIMLIIIVKSTALMCLAVKMPLKSCLSFDLTHKHKNMSSRVTILITSRLHRIVQAL